MVAASLYGESVAVKQLEVSVLTREFATLFLKEAEVLSQCHHPNIVRFVGGCVAPPLVCLVLECCDTSVHRLVHPRGLDTSEPPPAAAEVCALLGGVISGMDYIHNVQGLLHGDLKPLNMLIKGQKVKLCDFGSSQLLRHAPADLASTGTLPYLAPEILRSAVDEPSDRPRAGDPAPRAGDPATDVYSFGVSVWEMCTRLYPWHSLLRRGSVDELKRRVAEGERPGESVGVALPLRLLIDACWRQTPGERPGFAALQELNIEAPPPKSIHRISPAIAFFFARLLLCPPVVTAPHFSRFFRACITAFPPPPPRAGSRIRPRRGAAARGARGEPFRGGALRGAPSREGSFPGSARRRAHAPLVADGLVASVHLWRGARGVSARGRGVSGGGNRSQCWLARFDCGVGGGRVKLRALWRRNRA